MGRGRPRKQGRGMELAFKEHEWALQQIEDLKREKKKLQEDFDKKWLGYDNLIENLQVLKRRVKWLDKNIIAMMFHGGGVWTKEKGSLVKRIDKQIQLEKRKR